MRNGKTVIWFNQWFSSIYHVLKDLKANNDVFIIASSRNTEHVYLTEADLVLIEPEDATYYREFVKDTCRVYGVDIFFPKREMESISKYKDELLELGVKKVVCDDYDALEIINDKEKTYKRLQSIVDIPKYATTSIPSKLNNELYSVFRDGNKLAVVKATKDEGADTVRIVHQDGQGITDNTFLKGAPGITISKSSIVNSLENFTAVNGYTKELMVMPYLEGPEVSVDCYLSTKGDLAIPRFKMGKRIQTIKYDKGLIEGSIAIGKKLGLKCPYNVQFRWKDGKPKLLEVNARLSGGTQMLIACGFNIPQYVLNDTLGIDYELPKLNERDIYKITQVETPVILEKHQDETEGV